MCTFTKEIVSCYEKEDDERLILKAMEEIVNDNFFTYCPLNIKPTAFRVTVTVEKLSYG